MTNVKRPLLFIIPIITLAIALTACGNSQNTTETGSSGETKDISPGISDSQKREKESSASGNNHILIAYFSVPEDVDAKGADAVAGASIVIDASEVMGNTEYVAATIQKAIGGDLFRIETTKQYPLDHEALIDQAADEQDKDVRPELSAHIENLEQYDTIILGFPNWWGDLPMPVYTFLEEHDLSGKKIIPVVTHGGSGFSNTLDVISEIQPGAEVLDNGISLSRDDVAGSADEVSEWVLGLGMN